MSRRALGAAVGGLTLALGLWMALPALSGPPATKALPDAAPPAATHGLDLAGMNRAVAPGDDFFAYANGTWIQKTEIPADRAGWGNGGIMVDLTERRTIELVQGAVKANAPAGSELRQIADYYTSFLDTKAIEAAGLKPLRPAFDRIAAIKDRAGLSRYLGSTLRADVDLFNATDEFTPNILGVWIAQDLDDPAHYIPFLVQGGLDMPDRDYYVDRSERMQQVRKQYQAHVAKMLGLAQVPDAEARAARIVEFETRIAQAHATREESVSVQGGNNHWDRVEFDRRAPGLDWNAYFTEAGLGKQPRFIVWQPKAVAGIAALVAGQPLDTWKDYLVFHAIEARAEVLPAAFDTEHFAFHAHVLAGVPQQRPRDRRALDATNEALGEAVGKLYVKHYFPPSEKARAEAMVANLIAAFRERIDKLPWMAPETKTKAKAKLAVLKVGVGYPDTWRDYKGLSVIAGDAFGNLERAEMFEYHRNLAKLGHPVDRSEWVMTPQTVNAVNLPAMNAMNFPAAILQPPFFDPQRPAVMDYGNTGATIGHEISHSFDDQGALFDAEGRLANWWTKDDFAHFNAAAARLAEQYSRYQPFPDMHVNGQLTLSENIADVAGLLAAYDAWKMQAGTKPVAAWQGLSGDQQFFVSFAQGWRTKMREAAARQRLITDGHAPAEYRADTVRNIDAWYQAFDVKPGQKLYLAPAERVRIW